MTMAPERTREAETTLGTVAPCCVEHEQTAADLEALLGRLANRDRWCQGSFDRNGQHCVLGHLANLLDESPATDEWFQERYTRAVAAIQTTYSEPISVFSYNDEYGYEAIVGRVREALTTARCG